jgi:prepilin-type N-terminal cleavage/methylation domain-containing protein/prepilin-type processing-associated H-X9-DG protein
MTREARAARACGFTLVELLVVVTIIALLLSILAPSLRSARETVKRAMCASNQRQLVIAAHAYAVDNRDFLNPVEDYRYVGTTRIETTFRYLLFPLVGRSPKIFDCPSERKAVYADGLSSADAAYGSLTLAPGTDWAHLYGVLHLYERWNASGIGIAGPHWIRKSDPAWATRPRCMAFGRPVESGYREGMHKFSEIQSPGELICFGDGGSGTATLWADDNWWIKSAAAGFAQGDPGFNRLQQDDYGCRRHRSAANYVFADGHTQVLKPNLIRCDEGACWWSFRRDVHRVADMKMAGTH